MENNANLGEAGWRIMIIWECAVKGRNGWPFKDLIEETCMWLESGGVAGEIAGKDG